MSQIPWRRTLGLAAIWVGAIVAAKLVASALDAAGVITMETPFPVILLGTIIGLTYGLLAVGLVLIYRTNRIINFAHGQIGAFGAAFFGVAAVRWNVPYWIAFAMAFVVAGAVGAAAETGVIRRLRSAPRLMSIVATLGIGQFLIAFSAVINNTASAGATYPEPAGLPDFNVGALRVTPAYSGMLILSPIIVLVLALFLTRSRFGLAMRAAAANPEAARMAGIFSSRMSTLAWVIAGCLSVFSAVLTAPTQGFSGGDTFGPALLLRAMAAAVLARMNSLPQALLGGVALGILEQVLLWNYPRSGLVEVALFVIILLALLLQRQRGGRDEEKNSWASVQALRPIPAQLRQLRIVRFMGPALTLLLLTVLALLPLVLSNTHSVSATSMISFAIVGLSIGVLTGLGGQLTLGQFAVAAVGAVISYKVSSRIGDFPLALLYAGLGAGIVSVLVGLPALRIRGVMLTVTTLSFALALPAWLITQPWMLGDGVDPGRPIVFGHPLDTGRSYYYFALTLFVIALLISYNIRRSGFGRLLVAVRDNEDNARAFTIRASLVKVQGYLVAGFIAGIGGAAYGHSLSNIGVSTYPAALSISVVVMTVLGGISVLAGPLLGVLYVFGIPLLPLDSAGLAATQFGALLLILWKPAGIIQLFEPVRDMFVRRVARFYGVDADAVYADTDTDAVEARGSVVTADRAAPLTSAGRESRRPARHGTLLLHARGLRKRFGGVQAVDLVDLDVRAGETVGLIGPNGAGKTTTFELLGGFTRLDAGRVVFDQRDVTYLTPEARGRLGLIRSFQDAALFPTMTVTEVVQLALERTHPTKFLSSVVGLDFGERRKAERARALVSFMGLGAYRDKQIQELSTGTRRITEIACLVALEPVLLLLDEPSSGIAQRETEALGHTLQELKRQLDVTLLIIEHDIPLIMGISDRIIAMADGRVLASGSPDVVREDPRVVEAYLGGSLTAIERSGATAGAAVGAVTAR